MNQFPYFTEEDLPEVSCGEGVEIDTAYSDAELAAEDDDDEELDATPEDVILILGFDPFPSD